jgi:hypothetical protein
MAVRSPAKPRFFTKPRLREWEKRYELVAGGPSGLCFPYANLALRRFGDDAVVVHAKVLATTHGKRRIDHAWIEHAGHVYDYQNAEILGITVPVSTFYQVARPTQVKRYAPDEALIMSCRTSHHGPWTGKRTT